MPNQTPSETPTLKFCPFCGSIAESDSLQGFTSNNGKRLNRRAIYCTECSVQMDACDEESPDVTMDDLVKQWNNRDERELNAAKKELERMKSQAPDQMREIFCACPNCEPVMCCNGQECEYGCGGLPVDFKPTDKCDDYCLNKTHRELSEAKEELERLKQAAIHYAIETGQEATTIARLHQELSQTKAKLESWMELTREIRGCLSDLHHHNSQSCSVYFEQDGKPIDISCDLGSAYCESDLFQRVQTALDDAPAFDRG